MSTTQMRESDSTTSVGKLDMRLEVISIPVADVDRAKQFYGTARDGGSTPTSLEATTSDSSRSRLRARGAPWCSARASRPPRPARPRRSS